MKRFATRTTGVLLFWRFLPIFAFILAFGACVGGLYLEHRVTYSYRGTEAEERHGYLILDGYLVPDVFTFVQQDGAAWVFHRQTRGWGRGYQDGYHEAERSSNIRPSDVAIDEMTLFRGWYLSKTCLSNTPSGWLYVLWPGGGSAFVSPDALPGFIEEQRLARLPRGTR